MYVEQKIVLHGKYLDVSTNLAPFYSPSPPPSKYPNSIYLSLLLLKLAQLAVIFSADAYCWYTAISMYHLQNKYHSQISQLGLHAR